jgi:deoxyadenosine kinase
MADASAPSAEQVAVASMSPTGRASSSDLSNAAVSATFISIAGLIGAGKSSLCAALSKRLGLPDYYEPVEGNPYLPLFYKDMARYGFQLQIYLLTQRFSQQQVIVWSGKGAVQDRSIYEDAVFARMLRDAGLMSELDYSTYQKVFSQMSHFMNRPTVLVYLDISPEESLERIRLRSRGCESGITLEYLTDLHRHYEIFLKEIAAIVPVVRVRYDRFYDVDKVADAVLKEMRNLGTIRSVEIHDDSAPTAADVAKERSEVVDERGEVVDASFERDADSKTDSP